MNKKEIGFTELKKWLRHRHPMISLDRVLDYEPGKYIEALVCVSGSLECIAGHFPDRALYPGSNLIQAFSQCAIILFQMSTTLLKDDELTLVGSINARFLKPIVPGDSVILRLDLERIMRKCAFFLGSAFVNNQKVALFKANVVRINESELETTLW